MVNGFMLDCKDLSIQLVFRMLMRSGTPSYSDAQMEGRFNCLSEAINEIPHTHPLHPDFKLAPFLGVKGDEVGAQMTRVSLVLYSQ